MLKDKEDYNIKTLADLIEKQKEWEDFYITIDNSNHIHPKNVEAIAEWHSNIATARAITYYMKKTIKEIIDKIAPDIKIDAVLGDGWDNRLKDAHNYKENNE